MNYRCNGGYTYADFLAVCTTLYGSHLVTGQIGQATTKKMIIYLYNYLLIKQDFHTKSYSAVTITNVIAALKVFNCYCHQHCGIPKY